MLKKRVITALYCIPLLVVAVWFEQPLPWFTVLVAIWGVLAVSEFYKLVAAARVPPLTYLGLFLTLLFIISRNSDLLDVLEPHFNIDLLMPILLASLVVLPLAWLLLQWQKGRVLSRWAWTVAGVLYTGFLLSHMVALRDVDDGRNWVFFALFVTFASDTGAFFVGRALGRHKLAPNISPGKTWEGAVGGVLLAVIFSLFFILPTPFSLPFNWWHAVLLGVLVSIFGQLGDLTESLFKRKVGVKDSGSVLPGHGGFLDRVDSVVFAGAVVYYYFVCLIQ
ncbi:phosphatidate cytidylyltransferase [Chloroflexota bacterium]